MTLEIKMILGLTLLLMCRVVDCRNLNFFDENDSGDLNEGPLLPKECGYPSCPPAKPHRLNVHIVPHSHDDTGWLKTVEQYYYGANNSIQNAGVQYIYDSVIEELSKDPLKRFVSVEIAFFWRWWRERDRSVHAKVHELVNSGQLEFVGGGWCMNDEATAHYVDIIDQMSLGLKFLNSTFGQCGIPKSVWQIDPFGHSREQASIFAQMGFDSLFLGRIDYQDKNRRLQQKDMEMIWKGSANFGADIFTGILYNTYSPPPGFCFDVLCSDEPIVDSPKSPAFNVDRRAAQLVEYIRNQSSSYATNNILLTMGEDFNYQNAHTWYLNLDKLIKYINKHYAREKIRLFYSTPSCYAKAVRSSKAASLSVKRDDFFPYASDPHAYWTGYFTSRPAIKGFVRSTSNFLQSCKQLHATHWPGKLPNKDLRVLQRAMAVSQHHDAVSGTEKQHVAADYALRLSQGIAACANTISQAYSEMLSANSSLPSQEFCPLLNISDCRVTEKSSKFVVTVYNPLSWTSSSYVRFPVLDESLTVLDSEGNPVPHQIVPVQKAVLSIPGRTSQATKEVVFYAEDMPPLGLKSYHVTKEEHIHKKASISSGKVYRLPTSQSIKISKNKITLHFSGKTGFLMSVHRDGEKIPVQQEYLWYESMSGNNTKFEFRASGAYIFRPKGDAVPFQRLLSLEVIEGPVVTEVRQVYSSWLTQTYRLYASEDFVELDWIVGPIPVEDGIGKEIISRFTSSQLNKTSGIFYTDSNGREVLRRRRNRRPTFQLNVTEPVAGNYYPVNSFIFLRDESEGDVPLQMTVLVDRAQGGSSIIDGSLELMVHRRMLHDDAFGVGEALNETAYGQGLVVRGSHWLLLQRGGARWRWLAQRKYKRFLTSFVATDETFQQWKSHYSMKSSSLNSTLPENVNILTMEPWDKKRILVRLEHFYEAGEDPNYSKDVQLKLKDLFSTFEVTRIEEVNLSSTQLMAKELQNDQISLGPMEIRSFLLTVHYF